MHISIRCTESSPQLVIQCPWPSGLLVSLPTPFNPYNTMQLFSELETISLLRGWGAFPLCWTYHLAAQECIRRPCPLYQEIRTLRIQEVIPGLTYHCELHLPLYLGSQCWIPKGLSESEHVPWDTHSPPQSPSQPQRYPSCPDQGHSRSVM
jgi:hypothetical protein